MREPAHVVAALIDATAAITEDPKAGGIIRDTNGNTVGGWQIREADPEGE